MALHSSKNLISGQNGALPWMGTFLVSLPLITVTTALYSTAVVITGMTPEHMVAVFNMGLVSGATANNSGSTGRILFSVQPQTDQVTLQYVNNAATVNPGDIVYSFIATKQSN